MALIQSDIRYLVDYPEPDHHFVLIPSSHFVTDTILEWGGGERDMGFWINTIHSFSIHS